MSETRRWNKCKDGEEWAKAKEEGVGGEAAPEVEAEAWVEGPLWVPAAIVYARIADTGVPTN